MPRGPRERKVTASQMELLRTGNAVIKIIRDSLTFGSGNQTPTTNRKAHIRTSVVYDFLDKNPNHDWRPRRIHRIVERTGAGNCDQLGAMAYAICRDYLSDRFIAAWVSAPNHSFALIGEVGFKARKNLVAVDAWPHSRPKAVMFCDHFCYRDKLDVHVAKKGRGRGRYTPSKVRDEVDLDLDLQWKKLFENPENQTAEYNFYDVRDPWIGRPVDYVLS